MQDLTINNLPNISGVNDEMPMGEILPNRPQHAVPPQPTLDQIINTICTQLQLLATVIKQQPNTTPPEGNQSLQETVGLVLKQSDWFKEMVQEAVEASIDDGNFEDAVSSQVSSCVDSYFCHEFSLDDHCDVNEMVNDAVSDKIEEVVAEKLSEASVSISF
jgi:hypothetical protein